MNLISKWTQHLKENNMTYTEHLSFALFYGILCLLAGFYLAVHAFIPCFFATTGSDLVSKLSKKFGKNEI